MAETPEIHPGDIVQLKSGGPSMTAGYKLNDQWHCQWFDELELRGETFPPEALVKVDVAK
jgi:uncharacterized protein YodC (DUF2158 family)